MKRHAIFRFRSVGLYGGAQLSPVEAFRIYPSSNLRFPSQHVDSFPFLHRLHKNRQRSARVKTRNHYFLGSLKRASAGLRSLQLCKLARNRFNRITRDYSRLSLMSTKRKNLRSSFYKFTFKKNTYGFFRKKFYLPAAMLALSDRVHSKLKVLRPLKSLRARRQATRRFCITGQQLLTKGRSGRRKFKRAVRSRTWESRRKR